MMTGTVRSIPQAPHRVDHDLPKKKKKKKKKKKRRDQL
jgi:hypothetical protein